MMHTLRQGHRGSAGMKGRPLQARPRHREVNQGTAAPQVTADWMTSANKREGGAGRREKEREGEREENV